VSTLQQLTRELEVEEARVRQQICQSRNPHSELTVAKIAAEARKAIRAAARAEGVDVVAAESAAAAAAAASETQLTAEQEAAVVAKPVKSKKKLTRRTIGAAVEDQVRDSGVSVVVGYCNSRAIEERLMGGYVPGWGSGARTWPRRRRRRRRRRRAWQPATVGGRFGGRRRAP
jgi:hypothetical protein